MPSYHIFLSTVSIWVLLRFVLMLPDMSFWQVIFASHYERNKSRNWGPDPEHSDSFTQPQPPSNPEGLAHLWHVIDSLIMQADVSGPVWQQASSPAFNCHSLSDCIPLNARWHRIKEGDVFLILNRVEDLLSTLCVSMSWKRLIHL